MPLSRRLLLGSLAAAAAATRLLPARVSGEPAAGVDAAAMDRDHREFLAAFPEWQATLAVDELRQADYPRLATSGIAYLDYAGASLHADSQVARHAELLGAALLGNPHSSNPASRSADRLVAAARQAVLDHVRASADDYLVIFTPNATGALRLVGESYPFGPDRRLLLTQDNHNSVNGIGAFARRAGAAVERIGLAADDLRIDRAAAAAGLAAPRGRRPGLFAYPAQSNFSGVRHPLDLVAAAQEAGWDVLLDAAAFAPTHPLDLGRCRPEFLCLSFYKSFGHPTGVGCLLARRDAVGGLRRPWFAGGSVAFASAVADAAVPAADEQGFEDGTVDFLSLPAVTIGLEHLARVGIATIGTRVRCLTAWTLARLAGLRHASGRPLVRVHGPRTVEHRGGTIAFSLLDAAGRQHDARRACLLAGEAGIALRSGFFCNPGAGEAAFGLDTADIAPLLRRGVRTFDELRAGVRAARGFDIGCLRCSFGIVSDFSDAWRLVWFLSTLRDRMADGVGGPKSPE